MMYFPIMKLSEEVSPESLDCSLCCERLNEAERCPRLLTCGHSFCSECLASLPQEECPNCRKPFKLESSGVSNLPKNFALLDVIQTATKKAEQQGASAVSRCVLCEDPHPAVATCVECGEVMCALMAQLHGRMKATRDHTVLCSDDAKANPMQAAEAAAASVACPNHPGELFRYYDQDCGAPICRDCYALGHAGHRCVTLSEAAAEGRVLMGRLCDDAGRRAAEMGAAAEGASAVSDELAVACERERGAIRGAFESVRAALSAREAALVGEVDSLEKRRAVALQGQVDSLRVHQACLASAAERGRGALRSSSDAKLLLAQDDLRASLAALERQAPPLAPHEESFVSADVSFARSLATSIESAGSLRSSAAESDGMETEARGAVFNGPVAPGVCTGRQAALTAEVTRRIQTEDPPLLTPQALALDRR